MLTTPQKIVEATVHSVDLIAHGVKKISFKVDGNFSFTPSQYVWLEILDGQIADKKGTRRAFSILNTPNDENIIEIVARISESGYKQNLFALKSGDRVLLHGPFGCSFVLNEKNLPKNLMLIAAGVGIAPFLSVIRNIRDKKIPIKCFLVYLNTDKESTPFIDELEEIKSKNKFFDFIISYENFTWESAKKLNNDFSEQSVWWVAGPQAMVDHTFLELEGAGISKNSMVFENYYPTVRNNLTAEKIAEQFVGNNIFAKAIQNSTNHTVITDYNGVVLFANLAASRITGYTSDEIIGNTPRLWGGLMDGDFYKSFWVKKRSGLPFEGEIMNRRKNGDVYFTIAHIAPILDEDKNIIGYIGTEEDITELKEKEEKVRNNEVRFKFAFEGSRDGLWDANLESGSTFFSQRSFEIVGCGKEDQIVSMSKWKEFILAEDLARVEEEWAAHVSGAKPYYESVYRIQCKNGGEVKWVLDRGLVTERDTRGKALRAVGTFTDITETKEKEKELELMNSVMIDRELVMINLKKRLKDLESHI